MRILVTGGAGFIGSHLADGLLAAGHEVAVLDNLSHGHRDFLAPVVRLYQLDLRRDDLDGCFGEFQPQAVFHCAAQVDVAYSLAHPAEDARTNYLGTLRLLEACRLRGVGKLIYASSAAIYGEPEVLPVPEGHPTRPLSPYGLSKYVVEETLALYGRLHGLTHTVLRYANVYGPRQDPEGEAGVVAIFARRMLKGEEVVIYGDGNQERDFVYVGDVVDASLLALERGDGEVLNLGTARMVTVRDVFELLAELTAYRREPVSAPARSGEIYRMSLDGSRAAEVLGWRPRVDLRRGMEETVAYFRDSLAAGMNRHQAGRGIL